MHVRELAGKRTGGIGSIYNVRDTPSDVLCACDRGGMQESKG